MTPTFKKIEDLGYDSFFESHRKKLKLDAFSVARVIVEYKGVYKVKNTNGEYLGKVTGKQMFEATAREDYPAVGDWVAITELNTEQGVIHAILPRRTVVKRKYNNKNEIQIIATNVDVAFIVESVGRDYNLNRFERYFAIAHEGGIQPVVILNKIDTISSEELAAKVNELKKRFVDIGVVVTSTATGVGLNELKKYITKGKTYCFLGSSGVGKSSLINALLGARIIKTEDIGLGTGRGKHATTHREMYFLESGGIVIDNPGMREVGMADSQAGVADLFEEITNISRACKYVDCEHIHEPGCAVLSAVKSGDLDEDRYKNYVNLKKEADYYEMTELEKRGKDKQFGKFIKKAKKELDKYM
ncbi:MAG: ribosome small subunit-dependent GTPase A [Candidatus Paceibacterota bacterium]